MLPSFLRNPDRDWRGFSSAELRTIGGLHYRYPRRPLADRDFAAVPLLRNDGAAMLMKLTVDLVEAHAVRYWARLPNESFSFPSDE